MRMKYLCYLAGWLFLVSLFVACSSSSDPYIDPAGIFEHKIEIGSDLLVLEEIQLSTPLQLLVLDSLLLIHDRFQKEEEAFFFMLINRFSGEEVKLFGREGRGPDEYLFPSLVSRIPGEKDTIGIYNRHLFQFTEISVSSVIHEETGFTTSHTNELDTGYSLAAKIDRNHIIGTGFFDQGRYGISDSKGELIRVDMKYPFENKFDGISTRDLGMAFQSVFKMHPEGAKMVSATRASANLEILSFENGSLQAAHTVHSGYPLFENQSTANMLSVRDLPENRSGFLAVDVSKSFIYALYSGVERKEGLSEYLAGDKILIHDWQGNPTLQLNLDKAVSTIAVDENDSFLYGVTTHSPGGPEIYIYELPVQQPEPPSN